MNTQAESHLGDGANGAAPEFKALPTPTEADQLRDKLAVAVATNAELGEKLADANNALSSVRELQERTSHELAQTKATLAETSAQVTAQFNTIEELNEAIEQKRRDIETLTTERDEAQAQWEEWSAHPFFSAVLELTRQSNGKPVTEELAEKMRELVAAVGDTGKGGTVSLVVGAKLMEGQAHAMVIGAKVTSKLPKGDPDTAIVFMNDKGQMTSEDPRQKRLPLPGDKARKPKVNEKHELAKAKSATVVEIQADAGKDGPTELSAEEEEIYGRAVKIASEATVVSAALLQRRLKISFAQASRICEALKNRGEI